MGSAEKKTNFGATDIEEGFVILTTRVPPQSLAEKKD